MAEQGQHLFVEVFPLETASIPSLTAYRLQVKHETAKVGGKLAYRLRAQFPGTWVWAGNRILTDTPPNPVKLLMAVDELIKTQSDVYKALVSIEEDYQWEPTAEALAEYVARGPVEALGAQMREALSRMAFTVRNARVERDFRVKTWTVDAGDGSTVLPSLSFSIISHLVTDPDLYTYASGLEKQNAMVGLRVSDKSSTMEGEVVKVVGAIGEHRDRLLELTQRDVMRTLLQSAPADDVVVRVASGQNHYDYAASALYVHVGLDEARDFDVHPGHASRALRMKPVLRAQMVKAVADIAKAEKLIGNAYSTQNAPQLFSNMATTIDVAVGQGKVRPYEVELLPYEFAKYGAYWRRDEFETRPLKLGIINTLDEAVDDFVEALRRMIERDFGFNIEVIRERKVRVVTQSNLESAVRTLQKESFDVLLAFFADDDDDEDDEGANDPFIKQQTIGRGLPCLVIHQRTLHNPETMSSLVMGILARAGNVPYLFDVPLGFCDFVVGLDFIEEHKRAGDTLTGVARIYRNDGALLCYLVASAPLERGVGIPYAVLARLLPADVFGGKRVVLHHDGSFRREVLRALGEWEAEIDATFCPVEIIRHGAPRMYAWENGKIAQPAAGSVFRINNCEALLTASTTFGDSTPQPMHIRTEAPLTIEQAIESILTFATLHYGALKTPKLPVTIHHADHVRSSILRGVLPHNLEGDVPFWL